MSCNCNCNSGSASSSAMTIQQGDTFGLVFQYKEDGTEMALPTGYDLIVGIYDNKSNLLTSGKVSDGTIATNDNDTYTLGIDHATSLAMTGKVTIELTIASEDGSVVDHASDTVVMSFTPRRNNALL